MDISEQLFERAKRVLPGGVNSPVRAYRAVGMAPRFITRADGAYIYDEDGKRRQKSIALGIPVKGNKRKAQAQLEELKRAYSLGLPQEGKTGRPHPPGGGHRRADDQHGAQH